MPCGPVDSGIMLPRGSCLPFGSLFGVRLSLMRGLACHIEFFMLAQHFSLTLVTLFYINPAAYRCYNPPSISAFFNLRRGTGGETMQAGSCSPFQYVELIFFVSRMTNLSQGTR